MEISFCEELFPSMQCYAMCLICCVAGLLYIFVYNCGLYSGKWKSPFVRSSFHQCNVMCLVCCVAGFLYIFVIVVCIQGNGNLLL